jgi:hypothetical protein
MSSLMIRDLSRTRELDRHAMSAVAGGTGSSVPGLPSMPGLSGIANVSVKVNQNLTQVQTVNVIGAGFVPLDLNVSPSLFGANYANV